MKYVFLSIPVQGARLRNRTYEVLMDVLVKMDVLVLNPEVMNPPVPTEVKKYSPSSIHHHNIGLLQHAHLLIAEITAPSLGVGYEIAIASTIGIPILCLYQCSKEQRVSLMVRGAAGPQLRVLPYDKPSDLHRIVASALIDFTPEITATPLSSVSSSASGVDQHFDKLAAFYDDTTEWRQDGRLLSWFRSVLPGGHHCLDVGTGTGLIAAILRLDYAVVVGVDRSAGMLARARARVDPCVRADALALPFGDRVFDVVTVRQVLQYVDDERCLQQIARVLNRHGHFASAHIAAQDDELREWWDALKCEVQPLRCRYYSVASLERIITSAGFEIERVDRLEITRRDPWDRFFSNIVDRPGAIARARAHLEKTPQNIARRLGLAVSDREITYQQNWALIVARPFTKG